VIVSFGSLYLSRLLFGDFSSNKGDTDVNGTQERASATVLSGPGNKKRKKGRIEFFNTEASSKDAIVSTGQFLELLVPGPIRSVGFHTTVPLELAVGIRRRKYDFRFYISDKDRIFLRYVECDCALRALDGKSGFSCVL
jgi:hypothetical protein